MNNLISGKKAVWIVSGTILIVAAFLLLNYLEKNQDSQRGVEIKTTELNKAQTPSGLPTDLPIDTGSQTLQNYESKADDGRVQSTKKITTKKDAKEALDFYVEFFKTKGYSGGYTESASTQGGQQVALMKKDNDTLKIVVTPDGEDQSIIEFTVTQKTY